MGQSRSVEGIINVVEINVLIDSFPEDSRCSIANKQMPGIIIFVFCLKLIMHYYQGGLRASR